MGFLKNLFLGKTEYTDDDYFDYDAEYEDPDWDRMAGDREPLDLNDANVMEQYVRNCLEQMKAASGEMDRLNKEYDLVTGHLTDLEEVEEIPQVEKAQVVEIAKHIKQLRAEHDTYVLKESTMTDREYKLVESIEDEIVEAIKKLEEEEDYKKKVKADLKRVDKERHAYNYRKRELDQMIENSRGAALITMGAAAVLVVVLFLMNLFFKLNVSIGYYITIAALAVALTYIYVKYTSFVDERARVGNTINELILLENKVKIRYVNNKNLLDYLYMKYDVPDAWTLKDLYERFDKEREAKTRFEKNEVIYQEELARLVRELRKFRVKDPEIWIHQVDAIVDSRDMVEVRHSLIKRRQKLRKQMEYNQNLATEASDAIKAVIEEHPKSAEKIMQLINIYEQSESTDD
ncbi:MAG: hypothetical protein J6S95_01665 [Lachnospiraceae bacterium]|nr:hypothetical protein [Lachnospiraceae bacterium]